MVVSVQCLGNVCGPASVQLSDDGNTAISRSVDLKARVWDVTPKWKKEVWALLSTKRWDGEMGRELSDYL